MKADEMIDFVLGQVDGADRDRLEQSLRGGGEPSVQIERLRQAINRLLDDGTPFEHPPGLAERTVAFVARNRRRSLSLLDYAPVRVPFRWADFAVAASIFIAGVLTLLPAIQRSRERMNQAGCLFNLQQLGNSLGQYESVNSILPYPKTNRATAPAGSFATILHDAGMLDNASLLDCPCNGKHLRGSSAELVSFDQSEHIRHNDPARFQHMLCWDYAYNVGYLHGAHPGPLEVVHSSRIPVIADQPSHDNNLGTILDGNSPNHGGRGQNVLFGDGSVQWFRTRNGGPHDPDIFLNDHHQPRPGIRVQDAVLVPAKMPFHGEDPLPSGRR
jgi:prepilin-type processing-associated H-X9-DG protein